MMKQENVNKLTLLLVVGVISAIFLSMIRHFLMAIFLAGIFSALAQPVYRRLKHWFGDRRVPASMATLLLVTIGVLLPLGGLLGIVTAQAIKVGQSVKPWVSRQISEPSAFWGFLENLPFYQHIAPYRDLIFQKAGELVASMSSFLINSLSSVTILTVNFLFMAFILTYTMFFFLMDGDKLLGKILYYLPLEDADEHRMLKKFTSVTRATIKGTLVIGAIQGGLAGIAFAVAGIPSAVFWGTIMAVLSIIPGIGPALVWGPATIILIATGHTAQALGLAAFCAVVVGSIDNFLRPILVGKDTKMHELMILFGTLGGIALFGVVGIIIGPIIAALFVTIWDIYGTVFQDMLPKVAPFAKNPMEETISPEPEEMENQDVST